MKEGPSGSAIGSRSQANVVKSNGGERCGNVGTMIPAGTVERGERKRTAAEASKTSAALTIVFNGREQTVTIVREWTFGRRHIARPWFVCPDCLQRRRYLYEKDGVFTCKICAGLEHACRHRWRWSVLSRVRKLRRRIGAADLSPGSPLPPPPRHPSTRARYDRLVVDTRSALLRSRSSGSMRCKRCSTRGRSRATRMPVTCVYELASGGARYLASISLRSSTSSSYGPRPRRRSRAPTKFWLRSRAWRSRTATALRNREGCRPFPTGQQIVNFCTVWTL
jgi:hypothetical protein